jgi:hypothetical protein
MSVPAISHRTSAIKNYCGREATRKPILPENRRRSQRQGGVFDLENEHDRRHRHQSDPARRRRDERCDLQAGSLALSYIDTTGRLGSGGTERRPIRQRVVARQHPPATARQPSREGDRARLPSRSSRLRLERERNRPGALVALSAHQEHRRTGDVPRALMSYVALRRSLECRGDRSQGRLCDLQGPRWCGSMRLTMWSNRRRARVALCAVASSGVRLSRVPQIGCDSNQPFRSECFLLCPGGRARRCRRR